jgi:hypothetical protein
MIDYSYQIDQRSADFGGGWRLRLLENGETAENAEEAALAWAPLNYNCSGYIARQA